MRATKLLGALLLLLTLLANANSSIAGLTPVYVMYHPAAVDYFYTIDLAQRNQALSQYGYYDYGVAFYVESGAASGTLPFKRFWRAAPQYDHFYTIIPGDESAVLSAGWVYEGIEGNLYWSQASGTRPLYRASRYDAATGDLAHFYTTNVQQLGTLQSQGWDYDHGAPEGYAYPVPDVYRTSAFVSQSIPTTVYVGTSFPISITMRNLGFATWTSDALFRLGSQAGQDNLTWGTNRIPWSGSVSPMQDVTFSYNVVAPGIPGLYPFQWRMVHDGYEWFGDYTPVVNVNVIDLPPAVLPTLVHATNLTANCTEQYCVKLYGFNVQTNAIVEVRYGGPTGQVVARTTNYVRGTSGEATTLELSMADPDLRWRFDPPSGLFFIIENPGTPTLRSQALHFTRDHQVRIQGNLDSIDGRGASGWVCGNEKLSGTSLDVQVHLGGVFGNPQFQVAGNLSRPDISSLCGGATARGFSFYWPTSWKDGNPRQIYIVGTFENFYWLGGDDLNERAIISGTPRTFTIPNTPLDALFVSQQAPAALAPNSLTPASVVMRNLGTSAWFAGSNTKLVSQNPAGNNRWGVTEVPVNGTIYPDNPATFAFTLRSPTTEGVYNFQWQMSSSGSPFGTPTQNVEVRVLAPPTIYPTFVFPDTF